jgi:hypothetical protein
MNLPSFTAEASLYETSERYRLKSTYEGLNKDSARTVHPAAAFRGCYWNYYDCDLNGFYGVYYGYWQWYICDNRYCQSGFGLVTGP